MCYGRGDWAVSGSACSRHSLREQTAIPGTLAETVALIEGVDGKGRELLAAYKERYVPGAQARGMVLERIVVSPPVWFADASNRLTISWTV